MRAAYDICQPSGELKEEESALAQCFMAIAGFVRKMSGTSEVDTDIDTKSSFADWLNNQIIRDQLKFDIKVCLIKNGYPPQYSPEVFRKVMEQVENFEENS